MYSFRCLLLWGAVMLSGCSWVPVQEADLPPPCVGAVCDLRASYKELPTPEWQRTAEYRFEGLRWSAPVGALIESQNGAQVWHWPEGQALKIKRITADDFEFPGLANQFALSRYRVADYPWLLFTQTRTDVAPIQLSDLYLWRMAQDNKGAYFAGQQGFYLGQVEELDFYYARLELGALRQLAFLVDPGQPDHIFQLMGYSGTEFDWFERVLSGMRVGSP